MCGIHTLRLEAAGRNQIGLDCDKIEDEIRSKTREITAK